MCLAFVRVQREKEGEACKGKWDGVTFSTFFTGFFVRQILTSHRLVRAVEDSGGVGLCFLEIFFFFVPCRFSLLRSST